MSAEALRAALERRLARLWYAPAGAQDRVLGALLAPLALAVGRQARRRRPRIQRQRPGESPWPPVVVIGNLVVGGSGKTPLLIALCDALVDRGFRPGIVARGYRARGDSRAVLIGPDTPVAQAGDEPLLIARRTQRPVAVCARRLAALAALSASHPECDVVLSDDGLQHTALPRAVEIAVFDARGAGNARCLPAGPLREPLEHLDRVDALVLNGDDARPPRPHPRIFRSRSEPLGFVSLADGVCEAPETFASRVRGRRLAAVAGIGAPQRFFALLDALGLPHAAHALPDHARIDPRWLAALPADTIVMTEKDAVKCTGLDAALRARCAALRIRARPDAALVDWLEERLRGFATARDSGVPDLQGTAPL